MILVVINHSGEKGWHGLPYVPYELDGVETIGVHPLERYRLVVRNTRDEPVRAVVSIDGIDLHTGKHAWARPHEKCLRLGQRESRTVNPGANGGKDLDFGYFGVYPSVPDTSAGLGGLALIAVAFFKLDTDEPIEVGYLRYMSWDSLQRMLRPRGVEPKQYGGVSI